MNVWQAGSTTPSSSSRATLTDVNLRELVEYHREKGALATIALRRVYDTSEFGVVEVDEEGNIQGFQEKQAPKRP